MRDGVACVTFIRDNSQGSFVCNGLPDFNTAISFVGTNGERRLFPVQKDMHQFAVMNLSATDGEPDRAAFRIYSRVNLTCATTA